MVVSDALRGQGKRAGRSVGGAHETRVVNMDPDKKWVRRGWKACARSHRYWLVQTREPRPFGNGDDSRLIYNNPWWFVFEFLIFMCFYLGKYVNVSGCLNFYSVFLNEHVTSLGSTLHGSTNNKSNIRHFIRHRDSFSFFFFSFLINCELF